MAQEMALQLTEYLLTEILFRLPVKSLLRFRLVRKNWCSLIQNPNFVVLHHNRAKMNSCNDSLLIVRSIWTGENQVVRLGSFNGESKIVYSFLSNQIPTPITDLELDLSYPSSRMIRASHYGLLSVLGPCNGVVCISDNIDIVLCNPATREFKMLPLPPFSYYPRGIIFSPTASLGFGYDPISDDYKVVRLVDLMGTDPDGNFCSYPFRIEIYSLITDSWREIDTVLKEDVTISPSSMFFKEAIHWVSYEESFSIIAFDLKDEVFSQIQGPDGLDEPIAYRHNLLVLNDSFALLRCAVVERYFEIWVMSEYGVKESWTKKFTFGPLEDTARPLVVWKDTELLMENRRGQLVSCNLANQELKEFQMYGVVRSLRVFLYTGSLVSLNKRELDWLIG